MAIVIDTGGGGQTYSLLLAQIAKWMNRGDLTAFIPDFVVNAEARIATDLRVRKMLRTEDLAVVAGQGVALPDGWLEFKSLSIDSRQLEFVPDGAMQDQFRHCAGRPSYYTIEGDQVLLAPVPSGPYTLRAVYYRKFDSIISAGTNWLLNEKPNLYLYAALAEASLFVKKPDDANYWGGLYSGIVAAMQAEDARATHSGSPLRMRMR